jgi:tRNA pseudouridine38-40 synthase
LNYVCVIEYDGTDFAGWQIQPKQRTVQGELQQAIKKMSGDEVSVTASGRTDAGVHAIGQVVNFKLNAGWTADIVRKGLNSLLPPDIRIRSGKSADDSFSARYDAKSRYYRYQIYSGYSAIRRRTHWCCYRDLDHSLLADAARLLEGDHDFSAFCVAKSLKASNRCIVVKSCWTKRGKEYTFQIIANRFLHGMVRSLVGTMTKVASNRLAYNAFRDLLKSRRRSNEVLTAPPHGLTLMKVTY